jgi:lipid A 4'-phosphatase
VFAGIFTFLLIWIFYGLIYRWRLTRLSDETIERPLERFGDSLGALVRRLTGRKSF